MTKIHLDNESELYRAKSELFNDNKDESWLLLNYVGPKEIHFAASGEHVDQAPSYLEKDKVQYLLTRINKRNYLINTIGDDVGLIEKGKKHFHKSEVEEFLKPYEISYTETDFAKINKNDIPRFH
ncbi:hypothetical protein DICPUDRAFT_57957 [Dictyostelium purpureum]|uniref:ADF-H domain-containing protein n=1 Tax=Dictyostelium purpureum TaxID=5786 RepID=F0ZYD7_DICPU|nr:uncharacterized protein DICPUDRAFT_57957 [Dictyostelium purpureum]EGC31040.1 hypothetical protein DICPUDRAFT_57957 [Dictyostelium purpureum]|eukprot:XP_003292428.1 hypothetical protein DICPUDRAFT_57957 [Dictyostelium purpureum]